MTDCQIAHLTPALNDSTHPIQQQQTRRNCHQPTAALSGWPGGLVSAPGTRSNYYVARKDSTATALVRVL